MGIKENLAKIKSQLPNGVKFVAVSKTKPVEAILEAYKNGHLCFGENKVQEIVPKHQALPKDIEWHFIGHLQSNKVKYIAPFVDTIHSVDSIKLLKEINKQALKNQRNIKVLLQVHIALEESKFGFSEEEIDDFLSNSDLNFYSGVSICGLMGMATHTSDKNLIKGEFNQLKSFFLKLKEKYFSSINYFSEISMGMSGDFLIAIEEGSTMIRLGSSIFGFRNHLK